MKFCKHCGKEMPIAFNKRSVYCSNECYKKHRSTIINRGREHTHCVVCGKYLTGHQKKFCGAKCKLEERKKYLEEYHEIYKKPKAEEKPKKRGRPKKVLTIAQINEMARAEGMNYGAYCAKYGL